MKKITFAALALAATMAGCYPTPTACFTASRSSIQRGETVSFNNCTNDQDKMDFTWTIDGDDFGNSVNLDIEFADPGNYTVSLMACSDGCDRVSKTISVY